MTEYQELVVIRGTGEIVDDDAIRIGDLYQKARSSLIDSVHYLIECGTALAAKKASLQHGEWLPWLKQNQDVIGFGSDSTARRLVACSASYRALTHDLDESTAIAISRKTWGHQDRPRRQ